MTSENNSIKTGGVSILTVVGVVFIILKLVNVITWSWWLVLIPFFIEIAIIILAIIVLVVCAVIASKL